MQDWLPLEYPTINDNYLKIRAHGESLFTKKISHDIQDVAILAFRVPFRVALKEITKNANPFVFKWFRGQIKLELPHPHPLRRHVDSILPTSFPGPLGDGAGKSPGNEGGILIIYIQGTG